MPGCASRASPHAAIRSHACVGASGQTWVPELSHARWTHRTSPPDASHTIQWVAWKLGSHASPRREVGVVVERFGSPTGAW